MITDKLYKVDRANRTEAAGILVKGAAVSLQVLGSASKPASLADLVDLTDSAFLAQAGAYSFTMLPQYLYFAGTVDSIEPVHFSVEELEDVLV